MTSSELVMKMNCSDKWDYVDCKELCAMAGLSYEFANADAGTFEQVVYHAADVLACTLI